VDLNQPQGDLKSRRGQTSQLGSGVPDDLLATTRAGTGPQVMATLRNLAITLKLAGHPGIAAACRHHARDATRTLTTLGLRPS
jgi:hypothetical protein